MAVTWFSDGQPSYNTMVDIDTNMFNHVSTLFITAAHLVKYLKNVFTSVFTLFLRKILLFLSNNLALGQVIPLIVQ